MPPETQFPPVTACTCRSAPAPAATCCGCTTRRRSGFGASSASWRRPAWSPSPPIRATGAAPGRRPLTRARASRNRRRRPTAPTHGCAAPASGQTPSSRPGRSSASSAAAPGGQGNSPRPLLQLPETHNQCPMTSKIPQYRSLTCEEESVLSISARQRVRFARFVSRRAATRDNEVCLPGRLDDRFGQIPGLHERVGKRAVGCGPRKVEWQTAPVDHD
jgi:hypothetical protein